LTAPEVDVPDDIEPVRITSTLLLFELLSAAPQQRVQPLQGWWRFGHVFTWEGDSGSGEKRLI
jgi:hypothetical protein